MLQLRCFCSWAPKGLWLLFLLFSLFVLFLRVGCCDLLLLLSTRDAVLVNFLAVWFPGFHFRCCPCCCPLLQLQLAACFSPPPPPPPPPLLLLLLLLLSFSSSSSSSSSPFSLHPPSPVPTVSQRCHKCQITLRQSRCRLHMHLHV